MGNPQTIDFTGEEKDTYWRNVNLIENKLFELFEIFNLQ